MQYLTISPLYKLATSFFLLCSFFPLAGPGQSFIVADGPISNTISDSRSANFIDLNNDGWEDIYISNGLSSGQKDFLYLNDGAGGMQIVTDMEIVQLSNPSDGASFADYNNDGHVDGVISSWHGAEDVLYINDGNAQLNYNANAGILAGSYAETAAFGDYNNDGWLDLYITSSESSAKNNFLYKNLKNGKFALVADHPLVADSKLSRGANWVDFNNDHILDLFVANEDNTANDLYKGLGNDQFEKITTGAIVNSEKGSMTASWADIDNDGDIDLFIGNAGYFQAQKNQLFINTGNGFEENSTDPITQLFNCTYGSAFADYDNDGDQDLLIANGFCNIGLTNSLYTNDGLGNFENTSNLLPENELFCSFGVAWGDINNDGFPDAMIANCRNTTTGLQRPNKLLINQGNDNNWLKIKLTGIQSNKDAFGARVRVKATISGEDSWQIREISSQTGYAGQNSRIAHFGLGDATTVDSLEIIWPAGGHQFLSPVEINQQLNITEALANASSEIGHVENFVLRISPNPVGQAIDILSLNVEHSTSNQKANLMIYDSLGQLIHKNELQLISGNTVFNIDVKKQKLVAGVYAVVLQVGTKQVKEMLVVQ